MKDTFDLRRFGWYARKEFRENWKAYALSLVGISAILGNNIYQEWRFVHSRFYMGDTYEVETYTYLALTIGITTWISSSYLLNKFSNRKQTFTALTLPVSSFEQFLYAWVVAVPLAIFVCYFFWKVSWSIAFPLFLKDFPNLKIKGDFTYWTENLHSSLSFLAVSAVFMWGAVTLGRLNFLKTLGILIAVGFILFGWVQGKFLEIIFPNAYSVHSSVIPVVPLRITIESSEGVFSNDIHSAFEGVYQFWWVLCAPLLLYTITYLKIKEKEV